MINLKLKVSDEVMDDIMATALEGGINYWCDKGVKVKDGDYKGAKYASDVISKGGVLNVNGIDVDRAKLLKGIQMYIDNGNQEGIINFADREVECDNIDAIVADVIVQFAVYGEIVYG